MASELILGGNGGRQKNPDSLPTSDDLSGPCPRCGRVSNFRRMQATTLHRGTIGNTTGDLETAVVLECYGCGEGTVVVEVVDQFQPTRRVHGALWWPTPGAVVDMSDIPSNLASAFQEGVRCVSVEAPHAAVAMFRNALAQIVQDKGSEQAKKQNTLNLAIKQMVADRTLHDGFKEWADHVRTVGNAGAHQENWDEIPLEQAQELQDLVKHLIDSLYIQPAKLARAMPARKRPKP